MSLNAWQKVFTRDSIIESSTKEQYSSFTCCCVFGMVISCVMAYLLQRTKAKGKSIPDFLITLGSGTPSVTIALALIMSMSGKFGINIYNTLLIMIIAYMIKYMLMGMRTVVSAMSQVHSSLRRRLRFQGPTGL